MLLLVALSLPTEAGTRCQTQALRAAAPPSLAGAGRPDSTGFVDSAVYPIRVHYRRETDAERAADVVLPAVETAWAAEIDGIGWPPPPPDDGVGGSDAFDVYLTNDGTYGGAYVYGFGPDVVPDDGWYSVPSYMALDERWITDADMLVFVAHELNHASQYAIDAWEWRVFPWESTAEAIAELVDDPSDLYFTEIRDFQELPFASLIFDGYTSEVTSYAPYSWYEYGGVIFAMFVEQRYGTWDGRTLLALWEALAQPSRSDEPDFVDALGTLDPAAPTAAAVYTEFASWRMFASSDDDGAHYEEGALWPARAIVATEDDLTLDEVDGYEAAPAYEPYDLGASYYAIDLGAGTDQELQVDVIGEAGTQWGLVWAVWREDGTADAGTLLVADGEPLGAQIPLAGGVRAKLGVVNAGPEDFESEGDIPRRSFSVSLALVTPGTTDTGTTPPTTDTTSTPPDDTSTQEDAPPDDEGKDESGGCGCDSSPGPRSATWLGALAALIARRRGR